MGSLEGNGLKTKDEKITEIAKEASGHHNIPRGVLLW